MKRIASYILRCPLQMVFVLLLVGCGSSHKMMRTEHETIRSDSVNENLNLVQGSHVSLSSLIKTHGNYVINFQVYDTRKPVDTLTGKPPVLADGQIKGDLNKKVETNVEIQDSTKLNANKESVSRTHEKENLESDTQKKESTVFKQIGWSCASIITLIIVSYLVRLAGKKKKE